MYYVYVLKLLNYPEEKYIGLTKNLKKRLYDHNSGNSAHTRKCRPWKLVACIGVESREKAAELEKYMKSVSGRAFVAYAKASAGRATN